MPAPGTRIETLPPLACLHCAATQATMRRERQIADALWATRPSASAATRKRGNACPQCGSPNLAYGSYDCGCDSETGYADAGERYRCLDCGSTGDVDDAAPALVGSQSEALRLSRFARRFGALP